MRNSGRSGTLILVVLTRSLTSLLAVLALALTALTALAAGPALAAARPQMRSIFQDDCLLVKIDAERHCYAQTRGATLDVMKSLGADTIKVTVIRDKVQRSGWGSFDAAVTEIRARGLTPFLSLTDRERTPSVGAFVRFVQAAGRRYPGVHLWSLYNEPNRTYFLRSASPRTYRALFVAGRAALQRIPDHARDTVLLGELAPRASGTRATPIGPLAFTRELFCLDARLRPYTGTAARRRGCRSFKRITAGGFAIHPYTNGRGLAAPSFVDPGDGVSVVTLGRLTRILDAATRRGRANRMSVWDTEMGFQSRPPAPFGPPLATQATWINWGDWIQFRNPRVAAVSQYGLDDTRGADNTGLRFFSGRRKPAYAAYRLPIFVTGAGRGFVRVWGQVRPGRANTVDVEKQARGRGRFRRVARVRTNSSGYFQRRVRGGGSDRWRLSWQGSTSRAATSG